MERSTSQRNRWQRGLLLGGMICLVGALLAPDLIGQASNKAIEILRKAIVARGQVSYSAEATITAIRRDDPPRHHKQTIYCKKGGKEQTKLLDGDGQLVMRRVSDGQNQWEHFLTRGRLMQRSLPELRQRRQRDLESLDILARNFVVLVEGTDTVAGRTAYRIGIARPGSRPVPVRKLWVDQRNYVELKTERYAHDGQVAHVMSIERINLAPTFRPGMFDFEPPENIKPWSAPTPEFVGSLAEAQRRARFGAVLPPRLPAGFELLDNSVSVHRYKDQPVLALRYTNGLDSFSIFQRRADPDRDPPPGQPGRHRGGVRTWVSQGFHFALVGRLRAEDAEIIRGGYR